MKCTICKSGETKKGHTTATLTKGGSTIVFHHVPGEVCQNCGEAFFSEETTSRLLSLAKSAAGSGVQIEVRDYLAA